MPSPEQQTASPASDQEIAELRALGIEIATSMQSDRQPRCVVRAFARPEESIFVLTMQGWLDLDAIDSPILLGLAPEGDDIPERIQAALVAFGHPPIDVQELGPESGAVFVQRMLSAVSLAFSCCLKMQEPGAALGTSPSDGFGTWLPVYTRLIADCHMSRAEARACPVVEAFALIATMLRNKGWREDGEPYAMREVE